MPATKHLLITQKHWQSKQMTAVEFLHVVVDRRILYKRVTFIFKFYSYSLLRLTKASGRIFSVSSSLYNYLQGHGWTLGSGGNMTLSTVLFCEEQNYLLPI